MQGSPPRLEAMKQWMSDPATQAPLPFPTSGLIPGVDAAAATTAPPSLVAVSRSPSARSARRLRPGAAGRGPALGSGAYRGVCMRFGIWEETVHRVHRLRRWAQRFRRFFGGRRSLPPCHLQDSAGEAGLQTARDTMSCQNRRVAVVTSRHHRIRPRGNLRAVTFHDALHNTRSVAELDLHGHSQGGGPWGGGTVPPTLPLLAPRPGGPHEDRQGAAVY